MCHSRPNHLPGFVSSADVARMTRGHADLSIIAFERVPPMSDLQPIEECAGFPPPSDDSSVYVHDGPRAAVRCADHTASAPLASACQAATLPSSSTPPSGQDDCAVIYTYPSCVALALAAARLLAPACASPRVLLSEGVFGSFSPQSRQADDHNGARSPSEASLFDAGTFEGVGEVQNAARGARYFAGVYGSPVTAAAMIARAGHGLPLSDSASFGC